jgi:hypothetical protein
LVLEVWWAKAILPDAWSAETTLRKARHNRHSHSSETLVSVAVINSTSRTKTTATSVNSRAVIPDRREKEFSDLDKKLRFRTRHAPHKKYVLASPHDSAASPNVVLNYEMLPSALAIPA